MGETTKWMESPHIFPVVVARPPPPPAAATIIIAINPSPSTKERERRESEKERERDPSCLLSLSLPLLGRHPSPPLPPPRESGRRDCKKGESEDSLERLSLSHFFSLFSLSSLSHRRFGYRAQPLFTLSSLPYPSHPREMTTSLSPSLSFSLSLLDRVSPSGNFNLGHSLNTRVFLKTKT